MRKENMVKILFVCHGNICRSVSAEYIMKQMIEDENLNNKFYIDSAATTNEEIGNTIYKPMEKVLLSHNITIGSHRARKIKTSDYADFDFIIGMDDENINDLYNYFDKKQKIYRLMDFVKGKERKEISDPWWTRDFNKAYDEIYNGVKNLINYIKNNKIL